MAWATLIWVFFPIPIFCLFLLSFPLPKSLERMGTQAVGGIFFTRIHLGFLRVRLIWLFFTVSVLIFSRTVLMVTKKQESAASADNLWYRKAQKFRAERNFWLSLFNVSLWLIVYDVYCLKKRVVRLKAQVSEEQMKVKQLEAEATVDGKNEESKKED